MAPIPQVLVRILAGYMTQALTRRLSQSPSFFRLVDRLVHEADHFPNRLSGRPVPPYVPHRDAHEPSISEQARDAWDRTVDDPGEPHDTPDPFKRQSASKSDDGNAAAKATTDDSTSTRKTSTNHHQRRTQSDNHSDQNANRKELTKAQQEMQDLLEKLRNKP